MKTRWSLLVGPGLLALAVALLPVTPTRAQTDPMMGPHLDQLTGDEFDKAFLAQLAAHQATAVLLAQPAAEKAGHQETRELARGIVAEQSQEIVQLQTWAKAWYGLEIAGPPVMMGVPGMMGTPGMAEHPMMSDPAMAGTPMTPDASMANSLGMLPANRLDVAFLSLMIPQQQGTVELAKLAADRAAHQELKDLAQRIIQSQGMQVIQMDGWLGSWYSL